MNGITELTAELSCGSAPAQLFAKQGDEDSRFVRVKFLFGGKAFSIEDAVHTEIRVQKPDGTVTVNDGTIEQDSALYPLSPQSLTAAGEGRADFLLFGEDDELISTVPARLIITPAPVGDEALESVSEYRAFVTEIAEHDSDISQLQLDLYNLSRNTGLALAAINTALGGMSFSMLTRSDYDALEDKLETRLYFVTDSDKITMYLGSIELKSGDVTAGLSALTLAGTSYAPAGATTEQEE